MLKAAVLGHPIAQSKSPLIHQTWLDNYGLHGSYEAIDIPPDHFAHTIRELVENGYNALNVTIPFKQDVMALCDVLSVEAQQIGAVNTMHIKQGQWYGYNTDGYGYMAALKAQHPNFDFQRKTALVLGAGGASRAVLYALQQADVKTIYVSNRTQEKAQTLCNDFPEKTKIIGWEDKENILPECHLLVNTTSLGMINHHDLKIDLSKANADMIVSDIVYNPLITPLLKQAQACDLRIATGIGMLLYQAQKSFEIWTGVLPEIDKPLEERVLGA